MEKNHTPAGLLRAPAERSGQPLPLRRRAIPHGVSDAPGSTVRRWGESPPTNRAASNCDWYKPPLRVNIGGDAGQGHGQVKGQVGEKRTATLVRFSKLGRQASALAGFGGCQASLPQFNMARAS